MVTTKIIDPTTFEIQQYSSGDEATIANFDVVSTFSTRDGRVESIIYDLNGNQLAYNPNTPYSAIENGIQGNPQYADALLVYPEKDVEKFSSGIGSYNIVYNFFNNELNSSIERQFRLKEISSNRKELRLTSTFLSEEELRQEIDLFFTSKVKGNTAYPDFYVNFGNGNAFIANNLLFDDSNGQYSLLVKLYQPLPSFIETDGELNPWICTEQRETVAYNVTFEQEVTPVIDTTSLKGPNFSLDLNNQTHTSVKLTSWDDLNSTNNISSASYYELHNIIDQNGVKINIDYTQLDNFIHFSSAEERVKNFFSKVTLIEDCSASLNISHSDSGDATSASRALIENKIENIISNFDGFESWMYFNSSSTSYTLTRSLDTGNHRATGYISSADWDDESKLVDGQTGYAFNTNNTTVPVDLILTQFTFGSIPSNAIINGVEVIYDYFNITQNDTMEVRTSLAIGGGSYTEIAIDNLSTATGITTIGGSNNTLGLTLTPDNIDLLRFKTSITDNPGGDTMAISGSATSGPFIKIYYSYQPDVMFPSPYPKSNDKPPFILESTGSDVVTNWYENAIDSCSLYDSNNLDILTNAIPDYLLEDPDNAPYTNFINLIGQHFDTLFTYAQDITNRYDGDNRLDFGISKDLVAEAIKSMGINLYTGNFTAADLYSSFTGINASDSYLPPSEDGQTNVEEYITASNFPTPIEDVNKQIYKRIYHNLPLLLKQKGSIAGLRTLVNCFGVPSDILNIKEFDINYTFTSQSLPSANESGSVSFNTESISLPPSRSGYIPSELLSPITRVQQHYAKSESYNRSLHYVEAGFSPQTYLDEQDYSGFDPLGEDFPDFSDFIFGTGSYYSSKFYNETSSGSDNEWSTQAFIRYVKFFDASLFQMIKDFTPARTSTATGVTIKPTIKERSVYRPASMSISQDFYSGSVDTEYYDWSASESVHRSIGDFTSKAKTGSFQYPGGTGGSLQDFNRYKFSASNADWGGYDLDTPISEGFQQTWSESFYSSNITSSGSHLKYHLTQDEFYNGEFKNEALKDFDYLNREFISSSFQGLIKTDNNVNNIYKKPGLINTQVSLATKLFPFDKPPVIYFIFTFNSDLGYDAQNATVYIKVNDSAGLTQDVLLANGSELNFVDPTTTAGISFTVGTPTILSNSSGTYVAWTIIDNPTFNESLWNSIVLAGANITYIAAYDPDELAISPGPWAYNDYNPLVNNSFDPAAGLVNYNGIRKSTRFMDADYSGDAPSPYSPINASSLIEGSASLAAVPDSNYNCDWWVNSRYKGNRVSSPDFNTRIIKAVPNVNQLFTSESLGFAGGALPGPLTPVTASADPDPLPS